MKDKIRNNELDYRSASDGELQDIAYNDDQASWIDKAAAVAELMRRNYEGR
ncbi:hypothetical protein [Paenibacillus sp. IITD108]|uniref:hypothetical protein n=1 Tax=Paenibacillus sp. IITD108 TaxID=3116649 RepID=UPI002F412B30